MFSYVRSKYLQYPLGYVQNSTNVNELHQVVNWFDPNSQPRNHVECIYINGIRRAAKRRLEELKNNWMYDDEYDSDFAF